jgi:hypothetical protein
MIPGDVDDEFPKIRADDTTLLAFWMLHDFTPLFFYSLRLLETRV